MNNDKTSPDKENRKVQTDKQFEDNDVQEGTSNSIFDQEKDESAYPAESEEDRQHKTQPEYIDRNNDSKDKS